ncbi:hypothetical protein [Streptomyces sp. NPDC002343]
MSVGTLAADGAAMVSAVAAVVAIAATLLVGWWGVRTVVPRRKLAYAVEFTPLLSSVHSGLTVSLGAEAIAEPHTATVVLSNIGRREIEAGHFNGADIDFDMHARIVEVLEHRSTGNRRAPDFEISGNTLKVKPHVIHERQDVTYKLLLDGRSPSMTQRNSLSASVIEGTRMGIADHREVQALTIVGVIGTAALLIFGWPVLHNAGRQADKPPCPSASATPTGQ